MELLMPGQPRRFMNAPVLRTDYRLMEVSEDLLGTIMKEGVVIKGSEGDEAVLCTGSLTYALKYVETTNLQLLVDPSAEANAGMSADLEPLEADENLPPAALSAPGLQTQLHKLGAGSARAAPIVVKATNMSHIEVVETAPRLEVLERLLAQRPYGLADEEAAQGSGRGAGEDAMQTDDAQLAASTAGLYTTEDLEELVQASAAELRSGLQTLGAVQLRRHWRLVEPSYLGSLLEMLICTAQQEGYSLDAIPAAAMCEHMRDSGYEAALVRHCLTSYGMPCKPQQQQQQEGSMDTDAIEGSGELWALQEHKVCVHFACKLLEGGRHVLLSEFDASWRLAVPEGMQPSLDMLKGEALMQGKGQAATLKRFSARSLPKDPARCFALLFAEQPKWEASQLEPYIAHLKVPGLSTGALLLKFARPSQTLPSDPLTYSAR